MEITYTYTMTEEERATLLGILWYVAAPQDFASATLEKLHKDMPEKASNIRKKMIKDGEEY